MSYPSPEIALITSTTNQNQEATTTIGAISA
jgi:hypothetical protein